MEVNFSKDTTILETLQNEGAYNPFSFKFNLVKNQELLANAKADGADKNTLSIIAAGPYFHERFFKTLIAELLELHERLSLKKEELGIFFIAGINEKEFLNKDQYKMFQNTSQNLTAFDMTNSVAIYKENPELPQNFTSVSEKLVDFSNTFFNYLRNAKDYNGLATVEESFNILDKLIHVTNLYFGVKNFYEESLYNNGHIEVSADRVNIDSTVSGCTYLLHIYTTIIENTRLGRYFQAIHSAKNDLIKFAFMKNGSHAIVDKVEISGGYIKYTTRPRKPEDFESYLDAYVTIVDYYPFISKEKLNKLSGLTISDLLYLHTEFKEFIYKLYRVECAKMDEYNVQKLIKIFAPKIKHSVLKGYLEKVTLYSISQIETFIQLLVVKDQHAIDFWRTPLKKEADGYYFPYLPIVRPNHLFLIDHWLEEAGEDLSKRGPNLEKYLKEELRNVRDLAFNKFRVVERSKFYTSKGQFEQIDLLIETSKSILVGEIKCIKYPMAARDTYRIFETTIRYAIEQAERKTQFLIDNAKEFTSDFTLNGKKVLRVVVINNPTFTGSSFRGIPIIDTNFFAAYFKSNKMRLNSTDKEGTETINTTTYYNSEEEFCDNMEEFLLNPPIVSEIASKLERKEAVFVWEGWPEIRFMDFYPAQEESKFYQ